MHEMGQYRPIHKLVRLSAQTSTSTLKKAFSLIIRKSHCHARYKIFFFFLFKS